MFWLNFCFGAHINGYPSTAADPSQSLPFIELGATSGVSTVSLPAQDDGVSGAINVPTGFAFANTSQTTVYVRPLIGQAFNTVLPYMYQDQNWF